MTESCSLHLPRYRRHLQLTDRLRDLDLTRAGHRAVEHGMTARHARSLADDFQALRGGFVAVIEDEAVRGDERGGAEVIVTGPERRAGGGATGAQDALGGLVEAGARFRALQAFFPVRGKRGLVDEIRQNFFVVVEERLHVHDQVFDDLQAEDGFHCDFFAHVADEGLAGQHVAPVDAQRVRAANAVCARTAERERAVILTFDAFEHIQHAIGGVGFEAVGFVVEGFVHFGVVAENFQSYLHRGLTNKHVLWAGIW